MEAARMMSPKKKETPRPGFAEICPLRTTYWYAEAKVRRQRFSP
jgi:hypothetical protein